MSNLKYIGIDNIGDRIELKPDGSAQVIVNGVARSIAIDPKIVLLLICATNTMPSTRHIQTLFDLCALEPYKKLADEHNAKQPKGIKHTFLQEVPPNGEKGL